MGRFNVDSDLQHRGTASSVSRQNTGFHRALTSLYTAAMDREVLLN